MSALLNRIKVVSRLLLVVVLVGLSQATFASEPADSAKAFNASEVILHHVLDDHIWHFFDGHYGTLYLPVIVHSGERGLDFFSSHNFYDEHHNVVAYNGYTLDHNHIYLNGNSVLDLSITKNVAMLFINAALMLLILTAVARGYKRNAGKAPQGIQAFIEPIIVFVRDEVIKPNIGPKYEKFLPYLLTLFFFILFGNLLGLLPGAANLTGNIAVTMVLAVGTFIITNVKGNRAYWAHIINPPVPWWLKFPIPLLPLVEVIGVLTKPISLMLRLFVAITAGHIVLLSLLCLTFIFGSVYVGFGASLIVMFINLIELLVAGIQAYVFTLFSSLYIGMAIAEHAHDDHH